MKKSWEEGVLGRGTYPITQNCEEVNRELTRLANVAQLIECLASMHKVLSLSPAQHNQCGGTLGR